MRNERGVTLVELLAGIALTAIVIGTATLLLSSVIRLFGDESQQYADDSQIQLTLNTMTAQLKEATQVIAFSHGGDKELRYDHYNSSNTLVLKSLYFNEAERKLTLFDFSQDGTASNDTSDFANAAHTPTGAPTKYSNPVDLSRMATSALFEALNSSSNRIPIPSTPYPAASTGQSASNRMLYLTFGFERSIVTATDGTKPSPVTKTMAVKLLADWTAK
ncbi:PulJ/GspJ family protein [Paenibacillus koleovorans]|uniref:PulJ/GspJ family protein n=1 Tax=Paenibacillus koleovorans TaxID=121608 RepID=UPI000FD6F177|nr:prepilin-type N-terminal cleavage/methylation domain-containing protein [Paenibacillus koleovorans]